MNKIRNFVDNSPIYNVGMIIVIICSLIPHTIKNPPDFLVVMDLVCVGIFVIDYILRWCICGRGLDLLKYPFTPMAIIDLLSILPSLTVINPAFRALRVLRLARAFRVLKLLRFSKSFEIIVAVFKKQKQYLLAVGGLAVGYILISAYVIFQVEPDTFEDFYDAIYWATVSLTTVGYGDIYATSDIGKFLTMLSAIVGIAIVALPAGIITAGYMDELSERKKTS